MSTTFPSTTLPSQGSAPSPAESNDEAKPDDAKKKATNDPRDYQIGVRVTGTVDAISKKLAELITVGKGEVFVVLGTQSALQPKAAMKTYGTDNDLDGDYEVVADRAFTRLPGLKTERPEPKRKIKGL